MVHPDRRNTARPSGTRQALGQPTFLAFLCFLQADQQAGNPTAMEWQPGRGWDTNLECHSPCSIPITVTCPQQQEEEEEKIQQDQARWGCGEPAQPLGNRNNPCWGAEPEATAPSGLPGYGYLLYVLLFSFPGAKIRDFLWMAWNHLSSRAGQGLLSCCPGSVGE